MKMPSLYGVVHSNRNFSDPYYWGKNQFNSSFPVALACYMRDSSFPAMYVSHVSNSQTEISEIGFDDVFRSCLSNRDLRFCFESVYTPYSQFVLDSVEKIDLVVYRHSDEVPLCPLEIKLTTLPDDCTSGLSEERYGTELVVRSPTMRYMALSMAEACQDKKDCILQMFSPVCQKIREWSNTREMLAYRESIFACLETFLNTFYTKQRPFLLQPIWKTLGKAPVLAHNCLDIFVWSDFAVARLFMDRLENGTSEKITRPQRAALRLARFLFEWSRSGKVFQQPIYDGMTFDTLNDKEFSSSGRCTNKYMRCSRLLNPVVTKDKIKEIVLGGGQRYLSLERRFDSILFFSKDLFEDV